ncbi:MAG: cell division protein, partial [Leptospiraceae bacterium]|nr:cell division protein [Leptospiraceae bacterium]
GVEDIDLSLLEENLGKLRRVKEASVIKRSRNKILVTIHEKKPVFIVNTNDSLYEVDDDFTLVSIDDVRESGVCVLSGDFKLENGRFNGTLFKDLANSVSRAFRMYPELKNRISEVSLRKGGLVIHIFAPKKLKVLMGNTLDTTQVRKLYASLAYFENQNMEVNTLDLRGDDAVFQ